MSRNYLYIKELVINSLKNLRQNKRRSFLTALGIIIGVSSVIIIVSIGAGAQNLILAQVKTFGPDLIGVLPGKSEDKGPPASVFGLTITTLTYDDAMALKDPANVPNVTAVAAYVKGVETASWNGNQLTANLNGTTVGYLEVEQGQVAEGRFFNEVEEKNLARVAVLGSTVSNDLFGQSDPLGKIIKIRNQTFEVIGVMKAQGIVGFQDNDNQILLPISSMQKLIAGINHIGLIRLKVATQADVPQAIDLVKLILRERHGITDSSGANDDFTVRSSAEAIDTIKTVTDALTLFLAAMAALSLLVGGIGIMNIMLIRVAQRTREIGLRKAVGATNRDIRLQFLVESATITLLGGVLGIMVGELVSLAVAVVANGLGYQWGYNFSWTAIILAVSISIAIGLIFGIYPAFRAAKLNPIEALRYE
jgi:putative ABC transport system permease protein